MRMMISVVGALLLGGAFYGLPARADGPRVAARPARAAGTALLLFPDSPYDPQLNQMEGRLKAAAALGSGVQVFQTDRLFQAIGRDPGAWRQAASFAQAALWFTIARQGLVERDDAVALAALRKTRGVLEEAGLLTRPPLLASIELMAARILFDQGDREGAREAFRTAALIDPNDLSAQLPSEVSRTEYLKCRREVLESERIPLRIEVSGVSGDDLQLHVNGTRVSGRGPRFTVELPPGRHLVSAFQPGARPDAKVVELKSNERTPSIFLSLEPGPGAAPTLRPFSLAEVSAFLELCQDINRKQNTARLLLQVAIRSGKINADERKGLVVGVQGGVRLNPGPDAADEPVPLAPVHIEQFQLDMSGRITWLDGGGLVRAGDGRVP